jgi:Icc protein
VKFVLISDLHLVPPGEKLWGLDPRDRFARCLDDIARHHGDASFCVITGDLVDKPAADSYAQLKSMIDEFPIRTFLLIGNHDERECFRSVFGNQHCDRLGFVQNSHAFGGYQCLFLDTFKGGDTSAGIYCERRSRWLTNQLKAARGRKVFLFMHHPPFDIGHSLMDLIKLEDAEAFYDIIKGHDIRYLFFGHAHRPIGGMWHGIPFAAPPSINHQVPLIGGSVPTVYSDEPAMYAVVLAEDDRTVVHMDAFLNRKAASMQTTAERGNWY